MSWLFGAGDTITTGRGDEFEVTKRLVDIDTGERYYRARHASRDTHGLENAEDVERRYYVVEDGEQ
jgi:hypothetical protein